MGKLCHARQQGAGNVHNLPMYAPNGKKDGVQILPVSDVDAKGESFDIKSVTRDEQLAAHRVPPQFMAINEGACDSTYFAPFVFLPSRP